MISSYIYDNSIKSVRPFLHLVGKVELAPKTVSGLISGKGS